MREYIYKKNANVLVGLYSQANAFTVFFARLPVMSVDFVLPTIFSSLLSVWYFTFMNNLSALEGLALHVFTVSARVFYGLLLSLPFEPVLETIISRMTVWIFFLVFAVDLLMLSSILGNFNHYVLSDTVSLLFSALFLVFDAFFVLSSYRLSVKSQLVPVCTVEEKPRKDLSSSQQKLSL